MENKKLNELKVELVEELEETKKITEQLKNKIIGALNIIAADIEKELEMAEGYSIKLKAYLYSKHVREVSLGILKDGKGVFGQSVSILVEYDEKWHEGKLVGREATFKFNPLGGMGSFSLEQDIARVYAVHMQSLLLKNYKKYVNILNSPEADIMVNHIDRVLDIQGILEKLSEVD